MKVLIGLSCIWGVFVLFGVLFSLLTMGYNDPAAALFLYAFSFLPLSLFSIRYRKSAAFGFIALTLITAVGFAQRILAGRHSDVVSYTSLGDHIFMVVVVAIPLLVAILLLRHKESHAH